jgi:hypothetical protein
MATSAGGSWGGRPRFRHEGHWKGRKAVRAVKCKYT